jgi:hypothetical protein
MGSLEAKVMEPSTAFGCIAKEASITVFAPPDIIEMTVPPEYPFAASSKTKVW